MTLHLTFSQVTFLVGTAVAIGVILVLIVYGLHKALHRQLQDVELKPATPRAQDNAAFALATLQGVIASLKEQLQKMEEAQRVAEQRAERNARLTEAIVQETDQGLMAIDRDGFIQMANPALRRLLQVDTWSRRRFPAILGPESKLAAAIQEVLQSGEAQRWETLEHQTPGGQSRSLAASILPLRGLNGEIAGAICVLKEKVGL